MPPGEKSRRQLRQHPTRSQILDVLSQRGGTTITDVCRAVGAGWGTVQHHLYLLRRAGLVKSIMHGRTHVFFGGNAAPRDLASQALLLRGRVRELVGAVLKQPGIGQRTLTEQITMSRKVLREYITLLQSHQLIDERRESKFRTYYPTQALVALAGTQPPAATATPNTPPVAQPVTRASEAPIELRGGV